MRSIRQKVLLGIVVVATVMVWFAPTPVTAHGGGIDGYGGHRDNKAGNYHAHRGPCAGMTFASQAEMLKAACNKPSE